MVKDEDVCVHCGLCAERCPTAAWDMARLELTLPKAGSVRTGRRHPGCVSRQGSNKRRRVPASGHGTGKTGTNVHQRQVIRTNDFALKLANVNGTGSASANGLLMQAIFRMGIPVSREEPVPLQHPGAADLVRGAGQQGRAHGARAGLRPGHRHERRDLRARRQGGPLGRHAALRLELAAGRRAGAPRRHLPGRAAGQDVQRHLQRFARADPDEEHRLPGHAGGAAGHRHGRHRRAPRGEVLQEEGAARLEPQGAAAPGTTTRSRTSTARCRSAWRRCTPPTIAS